jgi:DNA-binding transcriptional ArsR family regulator
LRDLDGDILELVQREAVTPDEVAKRLSISWATANGHLLKLVGEGRVLLIRKGRVNVYRARGTSGLVFQVPKWVKRRSLEYLSEELADYFPRNVTAAEMIERERRKA